MGNTDIQNQLDEIQEDTTSMEEKIEAIDNLTTPQVKSNPKNNNPDGKGGFADHPENINIKGTIKTPAYWINHYGEMGADVVQQALKADKSTKTMFEEIALAHLVGGRLNANERKDLINRVDGMPKQSTDITTNGKDLPYNLFTDEQLNRVIEAKAKQVGATESFGGEGKTD